MSAAIGAPAPDFRLRDPSKEIVSLDDFKGRKTLVVFIPFPFTGNCSDELCTLRDHLADLNELDANVVAITCDTPFANGAWSEQNGFGFPVLSDFWPHGAVADKYGLLRSDGLSERALLFIDKKGIIRAVLVMDINKLPDLEACFSELDKLKD